MKFLIDKSAKDVKRRMDMYPSLVRGQLCTPLTRYKNHGGEFAVDNGAYSGLDREGWFRTLKRHEPFLEKCLFCVIPDIVGNARRTDELYWIITQDHRTHPYSDRWAYVMQDGHEDRPIDWKAIRWLFIGGTDKFKDSSAAYDLVKTARALGIPVHVGRVNEISRYKVYAKMGCETCDGSGIARYDHMIERLYRKLNGIEDQKLLFEESENEQA